MEKLQVNETLGTWKNKINDMIDEVNYKADSDLSNTGLIPNTVLRPALSLIIENTDNSITMKKGNIVQDAYGRPHEIGNDLVYDVSSYSNGTYLLFGVTSPESTFSYRCLTGTKNPTSSINASYFLNLTNKTFFVKNSSTWEIVQGVLPYIQVDVLNGKISDLQILNVYSYFGNTVFNLLGTTLILSDGLNENGQQKTIEFTENEFLAQNMVYSDKTQKLYKATNAFYNTNYDDSYDLDFEPTPITTNAMWFNINEKTYNYTSDSGANWVNVNATEISNRVIFNKTYKNIEHITFKDLFFLQPITITNEIDSIDTKTAASSLALKNVKDLSAQDLLNTKIELENDLDDTRLALETTINNNKIASDAAISDLDNTKAEKDLSNVSEIDVANKLATSGNYSFNVIPVGSEAAATVHLSLYKSGNIIGLQGSRTASNCNCNCNCSGYGACGEA